MKNTRRTLQSRQNFNKDDPISTGIRNGKSSLRNTRDNQSADVDINDGPKDIKTPKI